jgi:GNAT superfamily N-acetyltransferase
MTPHEITTPLDPLLLPWLDLYETAFPPEERMLVSDHLRILQDRAAGVPTDEHLLAAVGADGAFQGLARWQLDRSRRAAWLWYMATPPEVRGRGIGSALYRHVADSARAAGADCLLLEVEMPAHAADARLAERRIGFYRRLGARLLTGIHYVQSVGPHQPSVEMHLMAHPFAALTPAQAFERAAAALGDGLTPRGVIAWE